MTIGHFCCCKFGGEQGTSMPAATDDPQPIEHVDPRLGREVYDLARGRTHEGEPIDKGFMRVVADLLRARPTERERWQQLAVDDYCDLIETAFVVVEGMAVPAAHTRAATCCALGFMEAECAVQDDAANVDPIRQLLHRSGVLSVRKTTDPAVVEAVLRDFAAQLNGSDPLRRQLIAQAAIAALKAGQVPGATKLVDAALAQSGVAVDRVAGQVLDLPDAEPWPDPVDGAALLADLAATFRTYIVLPPYGADVLALYVLHTHAIDAASISPMMRLTSPTPECGKTNTMKLLRPLIRRGLLTDNITPAALFRTVEAYQPTLLIDEADSFVKVSEELRGILNAGHSRGAFVIRVVGDQQQLRMFRTFSAKAIAGIRGLPATIISRSITIELKRKTAAETVDPFPEDADLLRLCAPLARQARRWSLDHVDALKTARPALPAVLVNRRADNWRAILAIADAAGGHWPGLARRAAEAHTPRHDEDDRAIQLIQDLERIFEKEETNALATSVILSALHAREDRPWREWKAGNPMTAIQLAGLLKAFEIRPNPIRDGKDVFKGYRKEDCMDAFARYPRPLGSIDTSPLTGNTVTTVAAQCQSGHFDQLQSPADVTGLQPAEAPRQNDCNDVTGQEGVGSASREVVEL